MKVFFITHTVKSKTGAGEFAANLINSLTHAVPSIKLEIITSENLNFFNLVKKAWKSDIIHAFDVYPYGVLAATANLLVRRPLMITAIGSGSLQPLHSRGVRLHLAKWACRKASRVTAISHYVAGEIRRILPGLPVEVINPGVDYEFWSTGGQSGMEEKLAGLKPYLLTVGEFKRRKGYSELLPVMKNIFSVFPDMKYIIVADKDRNRKYFEELQGLIERLGIKDKITVLSDLAKKDLRAVYRNAVSYIILPKNIGWDIEGFGMAVAEAAASGLPAVVGRGSGSDDAIEDGESGILVDPNDTAEIFSFVSAVISSKARREKLSIGAKLFAQKIKLSDQAKKYVIIYQSLL